MSRRALFLLLPAMLALAACDFEDIGSSDKFTTDFHHTYPLKSGGQVVGGKFQRLD